jgi:hypothetical protein
MPEGIEELGKKKIHNCHTCGILLWAIVCWNRLGPKPKPHISYGFQHNIGTGENIEREKFSGRSVFRFSERKKRYFYPAINKFSKKKHLPTIPRFRYQGSFFSTVKA